MSNNDYESLPNISPIIKKSSVASSGLNSSNVINNNNNFNNSYDCDSIISLRDEKNSEKKAFFDKVYTTKQDSKSIISVAKDLNSNIKVNFNYIMKFLYLMWCIKINKLLF
jgi:hypothetical protein